MAKAARFECDRCEQRLVGGAPFCKHCGYPTAWASHEDRTAWEVAQYRHKSANVPMGYAYAPAKPLAASSVDAKPRGIAKLFGRRQAVPAFPPTPAPKRVTPPQLTVVPEAAAEPKAEPKVAERAPAREPRPASKPRPAAPRAATPRAAAPRPAPRAAASTADDSAAVIAARLLNARVKELDAQVQQLRRELGELRGNGSADASIAQ